MPDTPPEVHEGRLRMKMITTSKIKKFEYECAKKFEESSKVWEELMGDLEMKVVEAKLHEAQEEAIEEADKETSFPVVERMTTILAQ